ncbi:hypothetical protein ACWDFL_32840 [Streptomyces bungoensis]
MTAQHPAPLPAPADRDPGARVAPAIATALMSVLGPAAVLFGGLSATATDSCGPDDRPAALDASWPGSPA